MDAKEIEHILIDLESYFDDRADCDTEPTEFGNRQIPNEEMNLLSGVQKLKEYLAALKMQVEELKEEKEQWKQSVKELPKLFDKYIKE